MTKNDVMNDIEEKLKKIGYSDKNDLEYLKDYYFQLLQEGQNSKNINISDEQKNKLENIYNCRIQNEKEKVDTDSLINSEKIKVIISTVSLANVNSNILEELPLDKTLRVCKNVSDVYLFYSNEASENFQKIKEKLSQKKIKVNDKMKNKEKLESENIINMRAFLFDTLKVLKENHIKEDEILIDLTVGMKLASIAMYKIAVENGIKVINWKEIFFSKYKKIDEDHYKVSSESTRIVFSAVFEIIKEILDENKQILLDINSSIERKEYETVANLYRRLDRKGEETFFRELAKVFNQNIFFSLDLNNFSNKLKNFVENILEYKDFSIFFKEKIKPLMLYLKVITDFNIKATNDYDKNFIKDLKLKYNTFIKEEKNYEDEADVFLADYYKNKMKNLNLTNEDLFDISTDETITDTINDEDEGIYFAEYYSLKNLYLYLIGVNVVENLKPFKDFLKIGEKSIYNSLFTEKNLEEYYKNILSKTVTDDNEDEENGYSKIKSIFSMESLKEKIDNSISYKDGILKIGKYDIIINLKEAGIKENKFSKTIFAMLFRNKNYILMKNDLIDSVGSSSLDKNRSIFKKNIIDILNNVVIKKLRENNHLKMNEKEIFIEIRHQNTISNQEWVYKINEKFF